MLKINTTVLSRYVDFTGQMRLSSLLHLIHEAAGRDSAALGFGKDKVFDRGNRWVISRCAATVKRLPLYCDDIQILTYPKKNKWFFYPRFTSVSSLSGELLAECETIWAVIDAVSRKPLLPKESGIIINAETSVQETMDIDTKIPSFQPTESVQRKVLFSDLDLNRHMNNTTYADWSYDLLGSEYLSNKRLAEFRFAYHTEAVENEMITENYCLVGDEFYVLGFSGSTKIYEVYLKFEQV